MPYVSTAISQLRKPSIKLQKNPLNHLTNDDGICSLFMIKYKYFETTQFY